MKKTLSSRIQSTLKLGNLSSDDLSLFLNKLRDFLEYKPDTGEFFWKSYRSRGAKAGYSAGCIYKDGYVRIGFDGQEYLAHRLAWLFHYGVMPDKFIDHINGVRADNRIENLRQVTNSENMQNQKKLRKNNTTGYTGVFFSKQKQKYISKIKVDGRDAYLGVFKEAKDAYGAYLLAKRVMHPACTI